MSHRHDCTLLRRRLAHGPHALLVAVLLGLALPAAALYKVVGPDGRVTYTDRPPSRRRCARQHDGRATARSARPPHPQARCRPSCARWRRAIRSRCTAPRDCAPCDAGRAAAGAAWRALHRKARRQRRRRGRAGARHRRAHRAVADHRRAGAARPVAAEWSAYLDAAGYPRESRLPRGWQQPEATPLVERETPRTVTRVPARAAAAPAPAEAPTPPPPAPQSGIRF